MSKTIEVNGKRYTLTKSEVYRAKQIYDSIPRAEKTTKDWEWAIEMALKETEEKRKKT